MKTPIPPRWADRFLLWFCSEELIEEIQGDLLEAYLYRCQKYGRQRADRMYVSDVFTFFKPYAFERYSRAKQFLPMANNYFKIAFRNILHRKGFTAINLIGLTFGLAAVLLIGLYLRHELTYDQAMPDSERIHRLVNQYRDQTYTCMRFNDYFGSDAATELQLIQHLRQYDQVEEACHFVTSNSSIGSNEKVYVGLNDQRFVVENILAMMGLAGVVAYVAYRRQKEIGIRRVHGASICDILLTFNKEFIGLLVIATLIALPLSLYFTSRWLGSFAYHITPQFWVVLVAGLATLVIVVLVVSTQAHRAAFKPPVEVLKAD